MRRTLNWIRWAHVLALLWLLAAPTDLRAGAQAERRSLVPGDPPVAGLIAISGPDADGFVEVSGAQRSVFPNAQVGIRNLYTYETVYVRAGVFGNFAARLRATPGAPLAIVPVDSVPPPEARFYPGSLPGGPGTIVYVPQGPAPTPSTGLPLVIDADLADWNRIPLTRLARGGDHSLYAVRGAQSLYLALAASLDSGARADIRQIAFTLRGGGAFFITFERDARGALLPAAIVSSTINRTERGLISASAWRADDAGGFVFEARLPLTIDIFRLPAETLALESVILTDEAGAELARFASGAPIPERSDVDAYYGVDGLRAGRAEAVSFAVAGTLNRAESYWTAAGRISTLNPERGAPLRLELDVELRGELDPAHLPAARLTLVPIALRGQPGAPALAIPAAYTNNGWSNQSIAGGVAIDNLINDQPLAEIVVPYGRIWRGRSAAGETVLRFPLDFDLTLPDPLADGLYTLRFEGGVRAPDGTFTRWEDWAGFRLAGGWTTFGAPAEPITWLPVVLNFGGVDETRLPLALLADDGADGARGILAQQDADLFALSNRTRFATSELVLAQSERGPSGATPRVYPLEPYLPNLLPNRSDTAAAPLIPFDLTTGTWTVTVTRPDGTTETLGTFPLTQLVFSTAARDDRTLFGPSAPVDMARLSAVADAISAYVFNQPGRYTIQATGSIRDIYGNLYTGGGSYSVIAGEPLDLLPAAPPGVPLQIGDRLPLGVRVTPATPAEIAVELAIIDQDGRITTRRLTGRANPAGLFLPAGDDAVYTADRPGIYSVTYRAQYAAPDGRLWIGQMRSAGVIEAPDGAIVAHGRRGVTGVDVPQPAWYDLERLSTLLDRPALAVPYAPYHNGDIVRVGAEAADALQPALTAADRTGVYADRLIETGAATARQAARAQLPLLWENEGSAAIISWIRPGAAVRQMALGGDDPRLPLGATGDDPLNRQIGAGANGARPGDYALLYGGAITPAGVSGYAAVAVYGEGETGVRPPGRGLDGGGDGGPLIAFAGRPVDLFFWPTGVGPGDVLDPGSPLLLAGQIVPPLGADVTVTVTAPDGTVQARSATANRFGWLSPLDDPPVLDQTGVWIVSIAASYAGRTSSGQLEAPLTGGLLGGDFASFPVFVTDTARELIPWPRVQADIAIPPLIAYNFNATAPAWTDVQAWRVLTIPGYILEAGTLRLSGRSLTYQYLPGALNTRYALLEDEQGLRGASASDTRTLTLAITGIDADGQRRLIYRTFTILYDRLVSLADVEGTP